MLRLLGTYRTPVEEHRLERRVYHSFLQGHVSDPPWEDREKEDNAFGWLLRSKQDWAVQVKHGTFKPSTGPSLWRQRSCISFV